MFPRQSNQSNRRLLDDRTYLHLSIPSNGVVFSVEPSFNVSTVDDLTGKCTTFRAELPAVAKLNVKWTEPKVVCVY
jgi:hypothetical protein